jgi:hypothetical protein
MALDYNGVFSNSQAVTASAYATNEIDLGVTLPSAICGSGNFGLWLNIETVAPTPSGLIVTLRTGSVSGFGSGTIVSHSAITLQAVTAGRYFLGTIGPFLSHQRYLTVYYTFAGSGTLTVSAGTCMVPQTN